MTYYVYHIPDPADPSVDKGYVGVTTNLQKRFDQHVNGKVRIGVEIKIHKISFASIKILKEFDNSTDAYAYEFFLRPRWRIGWNTTPGGRGYQKDNPQDVYTRAKMGSSRRGKKGKIHSKESYILRNASRKGIPRIKISCPFCSKQTPIGNAQRWHFGNCEKAPTIISVVNGFDCDGVIYLGKDIPGIHPGPTDVIITGRSFEEEPETSKMLHSRDICNTVYYNPLPFSKKTRISSGEHKGNILWKLFCQGTLVRFFYEDDWDQLRVIRNIIKRYALATQVIWVNHGGLIELENVRHKE